MVEDLGGATKVTGSYMEKDKKTGEEKKVKKEVILSHQVRWVRESLRKTVKALGKKYGQDSVLTQTKKTGTLSATRKGGLGKSKKC